MQPPIPSNEPARLEALRRFKVLDTAPEPAFDDLARLAARLCGMPTALISLVDERRQWFKAKVNFERSETCREHSFCGYAILGTEPMIVPDSHSDQRFHDNPLVIGQPGIRFYAGAPLVTSANLSVGTLCVMDYEAREFDQIQTDSLVALAKQVITCLETRQMRRLLRLQNEILSAELAERRKSTEDLKLRNQELEAARREASQALEARARFLSNVSHELRTPLNGVVGMTDLLLETCLTEEQAEYCRTLRFSTEGLFSVVNDILDFSTIGANELLLNNVEFDLAEIIDDAIGLVAEVARSKNLRMNVFIDWDLPARVDGDPPRLRQILVHLLGNAVKFTSSGAVSIHVRRLEEKDGRTNIHFSVKDTGVGIAVDHQPRIFHAFSQADESASRRFGGTGLGLAISKQLVEKMEGEIGFESELNHGSEFWFSVWLRNRSAPVIDAAARETFCGRRVLSISSSELSSSVTDYLRALGCEVVHYLAGGQPPQLSPFDLTVVEYQRSQADYRDLLQIAECTAGKTPRLYVSYGRRATGTHPPKPTEMSFDEPVRRSILLSALNELFYKAEPGGNGPAPGAGTRRQLRVLVVEDNAVNQKVICNMLRKLGHTFDLAHDGVMALEAASKRAYDLILMDCQMPRMDGYEATQAIRREPGPCRYTSIVALTASAMAADRKKCLTIGMNDYLAKPVTMEVLSATLQRCAAGVDATRSVSVRS